MTSEPHTITSTTESRILQETRGEPGALLDRCVLLAERVSTLEDALEDAQNLTEFLHDCLTDPVFEYAYPEQTLARLAEWAQLVPRPESCVHSRAVEGCAPCEHRLSRHKRRAALAGLGADPATQETTDHA